jgi:hypothetical protein
MIGQPLGRVRTTRGVGTAYYDAAHTKYLTVLIGNTEYFVPRSGVTFIGSKKKED